VDYEVTGEDFNLPDLVTIGLRQTITDEIRVMAGAEWSNWSRFETVNIQVDDLGATVPLGFHYDDGWFFSVGGEFDVTDRITLRAGIGYELSPIDDDNRTFRLPDNDRLWLSAGGSYKGGDRWSLDAGYSFISAEGADIRSSEAFGGKGPAGNGPFSGAW
jgi:long-chain fatty acid transport protein